MLDLFKPELEQTRPRAVEPSPHALPLRRSRSNDEQLIRGICAILRARGYKEHGEWLNGPCLHPEKHTHGDAHASFGVNQITGVGHCFKCGNYAPAEVAEALNIRHVAPPPAGSLRPYAFVSDQVAPETGQVRSELNIAVALIRQGKHAAARLLDLITDDSRTQHGQHTYRSSDLAALGKRFGLSRTQVVKATKTLLDLGLLHRLQRGRYRRVGIEAVRRALGLGSEYALVGLPEIAYRNIADYTAAVTLAVEELLPTGLAAASIAEAIGISESSLYEHEDRVGVIRIANVKFTNIGQPTVCFAKVVDDVWRTVRQLNGLRKSFSPGWYAAGGERVLAWEQRPSARQRPAKPRLKVSSAV
ncbi:MAG: hypothetical protein ACYDBJ_03215 [Aggregatilineales bacterium]